MPRKHKERVMRDPITREKVTSDRGTVRVQERTPPRNKPCPCGSGRKYKKCCGKPKEPVLNPYKQMDVVYTEEQLAGIDAFILQWGFQPNPAQLMTFMTGTPEESKEMIIKALKALEKRGSTDNSRFIHAVNELNRLITPLNQGKVDEQTNKIWGACLQEYMDTQEEAANSTVTLD